MLKELQQLARQLGVADHIVFAGNRDQEWLSRVIPHAAAVLAPSAGRALSEVAFGAAPTVAYDNDWHSELVQHGVTGALVPHRDVEAMAESTITFLYPMHEGRSSRDRRDAA